MEVIAAIIGAIIGAAISFFLTEHSKDKDERRKLVAAVRAELELNLGIACEILQTNAQSDFDAPDDRKWEWCEVIPFSESAWNAVISTGHLANFHESMIAPLSQAFAMVKRANFAAEKISAGKYHPREGQEYTRKVQMALNSAEQALTMLNGRR